MKILFFDQQLAKKDEKKEHMDDKIYFFKSEF